MFILQTHPSKDVQKNMLKAGILLNLKSVTDALIIIYRNSSKQIFLRTARHRYF